MDKEIQKGEKEIEEVEVGDNKGMTKEQREKTASGVGQQTEKKRDKQDELQATNKGEEIARKTRSRERRDVRKEGSGTLKKWVMTRKQEQRSIQGESVTQQREENVNIIVKQRVGEKRQCQDRGESSEYKDNDLQCLASGNTQGYSSKSDYNLRTRSQNKSVSTSEEKMIELVDSFFNRYIEGFNNQMRELQEGLEEKMDLGRIRKIL